ncbi:MBL fold metallo-hydrolase [SAR202 cluster bacterium AD-802-F09_MRT_200m]|nr:MBL fold metallo-hydrolase [SAR202 cluster bacterium AD-802-F09_MRT_200m]|tara:strand:- start:545 stop:1375 length:831 start_codon:yes stop_codon:yes gene_type:complete
MQITEHIYATHIEEDPGSFGAMHPGGTHIYFVGDPKDHMVVVDTGEPFRSWTKQILDFYAELGKPRISSILITHGHGDHIGGLDRLQEEFGCVVRCHPKLEPVLSHRLGGNVEKLRSRESVTAGGGVKLRAYFTPGHEDDHVCYYMAAEKVVFSGDTVLGNSSSSVRNLKQYMASLDTLAGLKPDMICPGHGQIINNGTARVNGYIRHRTEREGQVLAALASGMESVGEIVSAVYPRNLRRNLRSAAARNVRTHLGKLTEDGRVTESEATYTVTND